MGKPRKRALIDPQDARILTGVMSGESPSKAVAAAGIEMSRSNAAVYVEHIKRKYTDANGQLLVALENVGVDLGTVAQTISEGLKATNTVKSGQNVLHVPDFAVRHKYLETTLDVMGAKAPTKQVVETITTHEQTVAIVENVRSNPEVLAVLQRRLQERQVRTITIGPEGVDGVSGADPEE
jgi:hypothetical protein